MLFKIKDDFYIIFFCFIIDLYVLVYVFGIYMLYVKFFLGSM